MTTLERLRTAQRAETARAATILATAAEGDRAPSPSEEAELRKLKASTSRRRDAIASLETLAGEQAGADAARAPYEAAIAAGSRVSGGAYHVYRPDEGPSFFRDIVAAGRGDYQAIERLGRNERLAADNGYETLDGSSGATSFGSFIPPAWLVDRVAEKARATRVVPDLIGITGPPTSNSMTVPRITTGSSTAIQTADNATISETDIVTAQLTRATSTIAGLQDVAVQGIELADPGTDRIIFGDLQADYGRAFDSQCIIGTGGSGQLLGLDALSGLNTVTYTDATPTVGEFYPKLADAIQQVATGRFARASAILMHPRRWAWITAALDTANRPLVVPSGRELNSAATFTAAAGGGGFVGEMQGLPVYTSANIPTTLGAGTEDEVYVFRPEDALAYEGPIRAEVFRDVGSATLTIRFRLYAFVNLFVGRFPASVSRITGTGLIAPTF